jgi:hypothetical protein
MQQGWTNIDGGAEYTALTPRTFRGLLKHGLPHSRINKKIVLIRYSDIDSFLERFKVDEDRDKKEIAGIVDEFCKDL